jgi:hypothetical protein
VIELAQQQQKQLVDAEQTQQQPELIGKLKSENKKLRKRLMSICKKNKTKTNDSFVSHSQG